MVFKKFISALISLAVAAGCLVGTAASAEEISATVFGSDSYEEKSPELDVRTSGHVLDNGNIAEFKANSLPEGGLCVTYPVTVPEDGAYKIKISANKYDVASLSKYAVYIDDGTPIDVNAENILLSEAHPDGGNYAKYMAVFELNGEYELTQGSHNVTFKITEPRNNGSVYAFFEYFKLIKNEDNEEEGPVEDIMVYGSTPYTEKSEILTVLTQNHELANGYCARYTAPSLGDDGYLYVTYPFNVKRTGSYLLTISSGRYDVGHLSKYSLSFDGGADIPMEASVISGETEHPADPKFDFANMRIYSTNQILDFDKGVHYVTFKITALRSMGNAYQFLEYFKLKFIDEQAMIKEVEDLIDAIGTVTENSKEAIDNARAAYNALLDYLKPEISNYDVLTQAEKDYNRLMHAGSSSVTIYGSDDYFTKSDGLNYSVAKDPFTNGKVVSLTSKTLPDDGLSITYNFDIYNEGIYTLYLSSPNIKNQYLSPYSMSVDGGEFTNITAAAVEREDPHPEGGKYSEYLGRYKTKLKFELAEGSHTVTMKITGLRANGDVWDYLEYIKFVLDEDVESVKFKTDLGYAEIGKNYQTPFAAIGAVSGDEMDLAEIAVTYSSINPAVAAIDENGVVTPLDFGTAVIKAEVSYKDFKGSAEMKVAVCADGVYCEPLGYFDSEKLTSLSQLKNNLSAKVKLTNNTEEEKTVKLVLALYKDDALERCQTVSYTVKAGESADAEAVLEDVSYMTGMSARLYTWGDEAIPKPIGRVQELN